MGALAPGREDAPALHCRATYLVELSPGQDGQALFEEKKDVCFRALSLLVKEDRHQRSLEWSVDVAVPATRCGSPIHPCRRYRNMIANIATARKRLGAALVLPLLAAVLALSPLFIQPHATARFSVHGRGAARAGILADSGGQAEPLMPGPPK